SDELSLHRHLPARHSFAWGGHCVWNRFTSIVKWAVKSLKRPSSRFPTPPDVSQVRCEITDDPQGSTRPRLRPFASALHASAASRLHLLLGPSQRTLMMSYHQGPFGPYSAISSTGATPDSLTASVAVNVMSDVVPGS